MKIIKLDKRHMGFTYFQYGAIYTKAEVKDFCQAREWCWETLGASAEYEYLYSAGKTEAEWCFINSYNRIRILFKDKKAYSLFLLKFGK